MFAVQGVVKDYAWGMRGNDNAVAIFAQKQGLTQADDSAKAELWLGAHPSGSALVTEIVQGKSSEEAKSIETVLAAHKANLPHLLKVLSIGSSLSLQLHPDEATAKALHGSDPEHYKDPYDKPEMCIPLHDGFEMFCGFLKAREICVLGLVVPFIGKLVLSACPPTTALGADDVYNPLEFMSEAQILRSFLAAFYRVPQEEVEAAITETLNITPESADHKKIKKMQKATTSLLKGVTNALFGGHTITEEYDTLIKSSLETFKTLQQQFPSDRGCFAAFFLAKHTLKRGQAMALEANTIHAYLSGECAEIMKCSDNVIRAGLTNKFQDVKALLEQARYHRYSRAGLKQNQETVITTRNESFEWRTMNPTFTEAFSVSILTIPNGSRAAVDAVRYPLQTHHDGTDAHVIQLLCLEGSGELECGEDKLNLSAGECLLLIDRPITKIQATQSSDEMSKNGPFCLLFAKGKPDRAVDSKRRASVTSSNLVETYSHGQEQGPQPNP